MAEIKRPKLDLKKLLAGGRIGNVESFFMVVVAFFVFDLTQVILEWLLIGFLINWLITFYAAMTFWLWFTLKGVSFIRPARLFTYLAALGIDLAPGTDASIFLAFTWTLGTFIMLTVTRFEDVTGLSLPKPTPKPKVTNVKK